MKRKLEAKRLYSLGQFKNLEFRDTIEDIPEEVALDSEAMALLGLIQLLQIESSYYDYYVGMFKGIISKNSDEEVMKLLDDWRVESFRKFEHVLDEIYNNGNVEDE